MTDSPPSSPLSPIVEDYVKTIFVLGEEEETVGTSALAQAMDVTPASVTSMIKKLADANLVEHVPYRGVTLTPTGRKIALELIRHHRLIELFLHEALGMPWDRVHEEAERWEHVISEEVEERIDKMLGHPTHDPHGAPIPTASLDFRESNWPLLAEMKEGQRGRIAEVNDDDPALLRYVGEIGLYPGTPFEVEAGPPYAGGPVSVRILGGEGAGNVHAVGDRAAAAIFVNDGPLEVASE